VSAGSAQPAPLGLADPPPVVARLARALAVAPDVDPIAERILDGALAQFCDTGLTGSTMDEAEGGVTARHRPGGQVSTPVRPSSPRPTPVR
jgi:hypothetical protein